MFLRPLPRMFGSRGSAGTEDFVATTARSRVPVSRMKVKTTS
jgi:hypothetical protein